MAGKKRIIIDHSKVIELIEKGYTQIQIGKELGIGKNTIISYLKENNLSTKPQYEDLVGKQFGKLTVIKRVENSLDKRRRYLCKCECGNTTIVKAKYLNCGDTRSCGCYKDMDNYKEKNYKEACKKIGEKHGRLTIIDVVLNEKQGKYQMLCKCECGSISTKCYTKIKQGETVSCGCYAKELASKRLSNNNIALQKHNWYFIKDNEKVYCRSSYEVLYANYLILNNIDFEYEPQVFKIASGRRYTPDFYLKEQDLYIEIKGVDYEILDRGNQKEKFDIFKENHNIKLYMWEDLRKICNLKYMYYSSYKNRAKRLKIDIEDYLGQLIYLEKNK